MKFLILLLISFAANASYIPESLVGQDTTGRKSYGKKTRCESKEGETFISIRGVGNHSYAEIIPDQTLEENSTVCIIDCVDELAALSCSSGYFPKEGAMTVYCEKFIPKHVGQNAAAKTAYDAAKIAKDNISNNILKGKGRILKCQAALAFLSGKYSEATEAETDALFTAFDSINSALTRCKYKKAKRLIGENSDPTYAELKTELLAILN